MTDVNEVKDQFVRFLCQSDWLAFKTMAEYYLQSAAELKTRNIRAPDSLRLWFRNSTKRLFLGIGCELLLKSFYLKEGYCINKPRQKTIKATPTHKFDAIDPNNFDHRDTYAFGCLIDNLKTIRKFQNQAQIQKGFSIAMVFRNKEGHTTFITHNFDPLNYTDIEEGIIFFYQEAFNEKLIFQVSMEREERGIFKINSGI